MKAREAALKALYEVDVNKAYSNSAVSELLDNYEFEAKDKGLIFELVYGTIKNKLKIDYIISLYSKVKLKKISDWVLNIIRLGIYQIIFLDRIPDSAACNESVKLARKYSNKGGAGFVNGMLRTVCREKDKISYPEKDKDAVRYLSVRYSFPEWIVKKLLNQYGLEEAENFMSESNKQHGVYLRVNSLKTDCDTLINNLSEYGIEAIKTDLSDNMLYTTASCDFTKLKEYKNGLFSLQNISSKMAVDVLNPQSGDIVIDLCAAPGGKSCAAAEMMESRGKIYSFDIHAHKISLIDNSAQRLGIDIISSKIGDAAVFKEDLIGIADKVIADVPCTGIGTIHKKPDIKWTRSENDVNEISEIQRKILDTSAEYLKDGGMLLYSTCTVFCEENENNVSYFLKKHTEFEKLYEKQILTDSKGETGFYICKMRKNQHGGNCD